MIEFRLSADADSFSPSPSFARCGCFGARRAGLRTSTLARLHLCRDRVAHDARRDPWVNMLRTTIAAFAAGTGGADAVSVLPFTAAIGLPDRFARRTARNTQLLLLEESNLAKVADPAAGSRRRRGFDRQALPRCLGAVPGDRVSRWRARSAGTGPDPGQDRQGPRRAGVCCHAPQRFTDRHQRVSAALGSAGEVCSTQHPSRSRRRRRDPISGIETAPPGRTVRSAARRLRQNARCNGRTSKIFLANLER